MFYVSRNALTMLAVRGESKLLIVFYHSDFVISSNGILLSAKKKKNWNFSRFCHNICTTYYKLDFRCEPLNTLHVLVPVERMFTASAVKLSCFSFK